MGVMFFVILGIVLWIIAALIPPIIAKRKGYSFLLFFLISIPFWCITLFVAIFVLKNKNRPPAADASELPEV
ncbi:MAG: hypothetical protein WBP26_03460 [Candidatus Saccharimonadales bacterium]